MTEYEPLDPEVEANGRTILSFVRAFPDALQERGEEILADNGIEDINEDEWYPQEDWLAAFEDVSESMGDSTLGKIGKEIPRNAEWPPGTDTVVEGVESIDEAYRMNHRNGEIGSYTAKRVEQNKIHVECDNPYPCAFDVGIIKGVVKEFGDSTAFVDEVGDGCREEGAESCLYEVTWRS
jgi:predicted hydrocarbon binding protein